MSNEARLAYIQRYHLYLRAAARAIINFHLNNRSVVSPVLSVLQFNVISEVVPQQAICRHVIYMSAIRCL